MILRLVLRRDVQDRAAILAYSFVLLLFPLLLTATSVLGYLAASAEIREEMLTSLDRVLPGQDSSDLIRLVLQEIQDGTSWLTLAAAAVLALWWGSNVVGEVQGTARRATQTLSPDRGVVRLGLTAAITAALEMMALTVVPLLFYGRELGTTVAEWLGLSATFVVAWNLVRPLVLLTLPVLSFDLVFFSSSSELWRGRAWFSPGGVCTLGLWLVSSFVFRAYVGTLGGYTLVYGSLAAAVTLFVWLYLTGHAVNVGLQLNAWLLRPLGPPER